jgi:allantoate deiminase
MSFSSTYGETPVARCDHIGRYPFSENSEFLERTYLSPSHRQSVDALKTWMVAAGMSVRLDALGNLIGRYEGATPNAKALLIGSHIDSVRNGGRYDGALGVMVGIEIVQGLAAHSRRLPFAVEVIAFGDEEGSRFPKSMLCSRGIVSPIDPDDLKLCDKNGVSVAQALEAFGLDPAKVGDAVRSPGDVMAYIEPHIEQGPVLEDEGLPIGVVTGIAAQLRLTARFVGQAGHAGTSPMALRRDAIAAAAEAILIIEQVCRAGPPDLRGTVGRFQSGGGAFNVIAGQVEIGIDLRAATRAVRNAAADEIQLRMHEAAAARGLQLVIQEVQDLPECPCDTGLMALLTEAVAEIGVRPLQLLSGAGHDAMSLEALAPVAMLFIRCGGGVSHNPAEQVSPADVGAAVQALISFAEKLARQTR